MRIAVVGSGIAGLGAASVLGSRHEVDVFEAADWVGGHTHTVEVRRADGRLTPVDTGFIIHNERNYPLLTRLFAELGVPTRPTDMSFSATDGRTGRSWGSAGLTSLFAAKGSAVDPRHWIMLAEILRFFRVGQAALHDPRVQHLTLGEFIARKGIGRAAVDGFVVPMGAAIWSTAAREMLDFPAATFLRFYANHGMLSVTGAPRWKTIVGGSQVYVQLMVERFGLKVHTRAPVARIERDDAGVTLHLPGGPRRFDAVVVATHSDTALALLGAPTPLERKVLGALRYTDNDVWLHGDESFLPAPRARAAWNYFTEDARTPEARVCATYWMNRLQGLDGPEQFLVTLNPTRPIAPDRVWGHWTYAHPRFDFAALRAQQQLPRLQGKLRTVFAGAYVGHGFHEDGLRAGYEAAAALERALAAPPRAAESAA
jgi:predicted NAD/FAD-binding protein